MANWWDKNLTDKQKFRLQEPKDPSLLDVVSTVPNPVGDVASGLLAAQDVSKGNYGTAALNSLGLLPIVPSMGAIVKNTDTFEQLAKTGKMRQAKNKEQELNDLISGKSKFAEVRLNWDDPKTYNLADKLKAQGFDSTVTQQGKDMVTLFHKSAEDVSPVLNAKTPYDFGKAYGYTDNDIAAFYNNRYGKDAEKYWKQDSKFLPAKTDFEKAQDLAQQRAALPVAEGGLGLPVTNTAMDRANALGFDTDVYRGISPLTQELNQKDYALWAASNPTVASTYAGAEGGYVMPLKIKNNDLANIDYRGKEWDVVPYPAIVSYKNNDFIVPKENKKSLVSDSIGRFSKNLGSQGLQMENIVDFGLQKEGVNFNKLNDIEYGGVPVDSYVMFNPSNVRSRFAAFDPFRRNEADILAGVAPLAVGSLLGLNTYNNMQEKPKKEKKKTK